jgi:hypothetical protein
MVLDRVDNLDHDANPAVRIGNLMPVQTADYTTDETGESRSKRGVEGDK